MAKRTSSSDSESADWKDGEEYRNAVEYFHACYAMPPKKLEKMKTFHEDVLTKFYDYLGCCTDIRKIGGSYEGVKVVKSQTNSDFEFDVMFVLKIPEHCHLEIFEIAGRPGYAMLKVADGCSDTRDHYRSTNHRFFAGCLTLDDDMLIVDAGKTTAAFFGQLQKWMNTDPVPGYKLRPKQHGTAIEMDVFRKVIDENADSHFEFYYSVDIAPTFEIIGGGGGGEVQRYVAKPEKKSTSDYATWRRLFDPKQTPSDQELQFRKILESAVDELHEQRNAFSCNCRRLCKWSRIVSEARTSMPMPKEYVLNLQKALVGRESNYRLSTVANLQELNNSQNERLVAVQYFLDDELKVMPVPEKPGYAWLKSLHDDSVCRPTRFSDALKLCYLPGGKYLNIRAANDMLVKELRAIANDLFSDKDVFVRRDGPTVRIDVYPEKGNKMSYYCLDIVLAAYVDGNYYIGLPHNFDDIPDTKAWRRSYSYEETTKIQHSSVGLKKIFRVLKAFRNGEPVLAPLTSYHFKNLLLNMQKLTTMNWNEHIGKLLSRVLQYLKICLNVKKLQTYFIPEINLLEKMTNDYIAHMQYRIDELLRSETKMFKVLKVPSKETTFDLLKKHEIESSQMFHESSLIPDPSSQSLDSILLSGIEKQLMGYNYRTLTFDQVYKDITVYRIFSNEQPFPVDFDAVMIISNNKNNLRDRRVYTGSQATRLERCNSTVSQSLHHTVTHSSGLADTRKTAEYIMRRMEALIDRSSLLQDQVTVHLKGSNIVLELNSGVYLSILPVYEVGEGYFVAMPGGTDTSAWIPVPFTPVRNKYWKAFQINDCGRSVLNKLRGLRDSEQGFGLAHLSERHLRMAVFWEMEVQRDWSDDKFTERVNDVLDRLLLSIRQKNLPSYFEPTINTL